MAKKKNFTNDLTFLFFINLTVLVLLLTMFNLSNQHKKTVKVLGAETNNSFWEEMVIKHPTYRDAWMELGRIDKVKQIDPNWSDKPE